MGDSARELAHAAKLARAAAVLARAEARAGVGTGQAGRAVPDSARPVGERGADGSPPAGRDERTGPAPTGERAAAGESPRTGRAGPPDDDRGGSPGGRRQAVPPPEDPQSVVPDADPESVARTIVLRQLSMAPRSRAQLARKLRQRGCDDVVAARVLDRMTEVGLVDDAAYAELLVRSKTQHKGLSRVALAHELRRHGIDDVIAEQALSGLDASDERARAEQLVAKKMRSMHGLGPDVQSRRLAGLLTRKGYPGEIAWPVVRDAVNNAQEHRRD
ncbi:RecX family transcriptional regulator [Intrasporangium sp.]|uniref:regulatory protein RecX n=1 Tax=Intrasporangium sp. TaxID=1925024 RepID=UPI0032221D80